MCHSVTHEHTDALGPLGRPGRGRTAAGGRPRPGRAGLRARRRATRPTPLDEVRLPEPGLSADLLDGLRDLLGDEHVHTDHETRVRHTRGKSTSDLLRMRAGDGADAPDAVVRPAGHDEVAALVSWCAEHRVALVPFGGGTSVVGGLAAVREGYAGVVSLDLGRLDRLVSVDAESRTAVLEAGVLGPARGGPARASTG